MAHADHLTASPRLRWLTVPQAPEQLPAAVLVFVAAAFLLPSGAAYAWPFYLLVLPAACVRTSDILGAFRAPGAALALALIIWSGLTLVWGEDDGHRAWRFAVEIVWTLAFVAALLAVLPASAMRRQLGTVMIWAGSANAVLSVVLGVVAPQHGERLHGWGVTTHPILGAIVMTGAYFCALSRGLAEPRHRAEHLAASAVMALFIILTESRGPMFSAGLGTLFLCVAGPWRWRALAVLGAIGGAWLLLPSAVLRHQEHRLVYRGASHHFEVWQATLGLIAQRPILGHGLAANLHLPDGITFPHDLYLSVLFYSGAVGFAVFAALCVAVTLRLWRARDWIGQDWLWVAALWMSTLLSGMTDLGQLTKGPGPMWFILWLPVCLALTGPPVQPARSSLAPS